MFPTSIALEADGIFKAYGGTQALKGMGLRLERGEIHALVGGNGSGKSTFIKILAGVEKADAGWFRTQSSTVDARHTDPDISRQMGLRFVHQRSTTFPDLSIAENVGIGSTFALRAGSIDWREQHRRAEELLERYKIDASPKDLVNSLSAAKQTLLAIGRAMQDLDGANATGLVLDEPTACLPKSDAFELLDCLRELADRGEAILYVSHRLEEILAVADRVTVLRDGDCVGTFPGSDLDQEKLVELISGRTWASLVNTIGHHDRPLEDAPPVLAVENLSGGAVRSASFSVKAGEVLGVAGLIGSGRSTLLRHLFGLEERQGGGVSLGGQPYAPKSAQCAMRSGVALVPEDRLAEAAFSGLSVRENLSIANLRSYTDGSRIDSRKERRRVHELVDDFGIKTASAETKISDLSGGNQQKVILARWIQRNPRLLLLDEPTQGVDVGARADIYRLVRDMATSGTAVIVVSSDAEELELLCDRILVMKAGTVGEAAIT